MTDQQRRRSVQNRTRKPLDSHIGGLTPNRLDPEKINLYVPAS
jgi:hypothetical protein